MSMCAIALHIYFLLVNIFQERPCPGWHCLFVLCKRNAFTETVVCRRKVMWNILCRIRNRFKLQRLLHTEVFMRSCIVFVFNKYDISDTCGHGPPSECIFRPRGHFPFRWVPPWPQDFNSRNHFWPFASPDCVLNQSSLSEPALTVS